MLRKFLPQIIASLFLVGFVVYAWTGPTQAPPNCPPGSPGCDAPINVSTSSQYKAGALGIGGVFQAFSDAVFNGNVSVGTATIKGDGSVSANLNADKLDDYEAADLNAGRLAGYCYESCNIFGGDCRVTLSMPPAYKKMTDPAFSRCKCDSGFSQITLSSDSAGKAYFCYSLGSPRCGDGIVQAGEFCDDGNKANDGGDCYSDCSKINYFYGPSHGGCGSGVKPVGYQIAPDTANKYCQEKGFIKAIHKFVTTGQGYPPNSVSYWNGLNWVCNPGHQQSITEIWCE